MSSGMTSIIAHVVAVAFGAVSGAQPLPGPTWQPGDQGAGRETVGRGGDRVVGADGDRVVQAQLTDAAAQVASTVDLFLICCHRRSPSRWPSSRPHLPHTADQRRRDDDHELQLP